jgi:hypothetical protein
MDVLKTAVRDGDDCWGEMYMTRYLRFLATQAPLCVPPNVLSDAGPAELASD